MEDRRGRPDRVVAALTLTVLLGGCTLVGPKYVKPVVTVNPEWSANSDPRLTSTPPPDAAWWRVFNDATLDQLVDTAWKQNLPLQMAGLRIAESRAQLALAVGAKWPQVQAVFANVNFVGLSGANVANCDRNFVDYQAGFDAAWELDFWGRYKHIEQAEAAHYFATLTDYDDALVSVAGEVARTYALVRTFEVLIVQAQRNVELQEEGYRIAQARFRHGATPELDVTQARTLLESTRTTIPQLEISLRQSQNALSTLLGQPTGTVQMLLAGGKGIPTPPDNVAVSVPAELLRRRPDIRAAEFITLEQSSRIGIATADLYPRLSIGGTIGVAGASASGASNASFFYGFGPRLWLPIFDYGRTRNRIRIEDARFQQSIVSYQDTVLRAAQEVEDGLTGYVKSREASVFAQNAADAARRSADLAFVQYREGAVDFQRVIEAMRALLAEENTLARTQSDIAVNLIALYKALGGGWEVHQGQPVIPETVRTEMENRTRWDDLLTEPPPQTPPQPETEETRGGTEQ